MPQDSATCKHARTHASAQAREAAANRERYRLLYEADNPSKSELDAARAADESAAAALDTYGRIDILINSVQRNTFNHKTILNHPNQYQSRLHFR